MCILKKMEDVLQFILNEDILMRINYPKRWFNNQCLCQTKN